MRLPKSPFQKRTASSESGSITVFSLMVFVGIIGLGGLAVDAMYFEGKRVAAQDAMDRCALMAAIAQNRVDGETPTGAPDTAKAAAVASDCMAKSTTGNTGLGTPTILTQNSERSVTLSGSYTFSALFPNVGNAASKSYAISSQSTQKMPNLELTIAVDINHSVFWNTFKAPLIKFLNTVAAPDTGNKMTVNIVPFDRNVHLGSMIDRFSTTQEPPFEANDNRTCLLLPESSKDDIAIDIEDTYRWSWPVYLTGEANVTSVSTSFDKRYLSGHPSRNGGAWVMGGEIYRLEKAITTSEIEFGRCAHTSPNNSPLIGMQVSRPITTANTSKINAKLNGIVARAYAAPNYANSAEGMKWALATLDSSLDHGLGDIITDQIAENISPAAAAGRPLDYGAAESLKVLLFIPNNVFAMPTGEVTSSTTAGYRGSLVREFRPEFLDGSLDGTSDDAQIWRTPDGASPTEDIRFSIYHPTAPGPNKYWVTQGHCGGSLCYAGWQAAPFQHPGGDPPVKLTWRDAFGMMTLDYVIRQLYMIPMTQAGVLPGNPNYHYGTLVDKFTYIETDATTIASDFSDLCDEAKANGILVYTLLGNGVPANSSAATTYKNCATSPAHTFGIGNVIFQKAALRLIASNIAQLTLTQ